MAKTTDNRKRLLFETADLKLTRWKVVLLRPHEVVVRRLPLRGTRPIRGVLIDCCAD